MENSVGLFVPHACVPHVDAVMSAHVCAGPRVPRAKLMLVLSALFALSGIIELFYALWLCRARACDATWGDVCCMP